MLLFSSLHFEASPGRMVLFLTERFQQLGYHAAGQGEKLRSLRDPEVQPHL